MDPIPRALAGAFASLPVGLWWQRCLRACALVVVALVLGCASEEQAVLDTWSAYHKATQALDVDTVRSMLASGLGDELQGQEGAMALQLRSALVPVVPRVTAVEVTGIRATINVEGEVEQQAITGRVTFARESEAWKVLEEEWTVDLTATFPTPNVDLAATYGESDDAVPHARSDIFAHDGAVTALAFTRDGRKLVSIGYDDRRLCLWDTETGEALDTIELEDRPNDLALLPDGSAAYVVDVQGAVTVWPIEWGTFGEGRILAGRAGRTPRIAIDPSGHRAVTTSWDDPAKLWDLDAGRYLEALPKSERMRGVAFSSQGSQVACGSHEDWFAVWNLERLSWPLGARKTHRVPRVADQSDVHSIAFTPDGRRLATGHMDASMSIWDMEKGREMHNWYLPECSVMDLTFSPCGTVLATAQQDGKVHLWETESKRKLALLRAHEGAALSVAFNPADGVTLATGGEDGTIRIWQ